MLKVTVRNQQTAHEFDGRRLKDGARRVLEGEGIATGIVTIAVVNDADMHALNRRYLEHDYPTDVLSFVLSEAGERLEADVVISADYAAREAEHFGWTAQDEMLLYVIHGTLHAAGYDDTDEESLREMRAKEAEYLAEFGLTPRYDD